MRSIFPMREIDERINEMKLFTMIIITIISIIEFFY